VKTGLYPDFKEQKKLKREPSLKGSFEETDLKISGASKEKIEKSCQSIVNIIKIILKNLPLLKVSLITIKNKLKLINLLEIILRQPFNLKTYYKMK